jgi:2,4'-dihydroxyacetophenone dioxygenase
LSATPVVVAAGVVLEIAVSALPDERVSVPQAKDVWFRPLLLNTADRRLVQPTGGWCNLLRARNYGALHGHRHSMIVVG